jgi:hypothetical protein
MDAKADSALNHAQKECTGMKLHTIWIDKRSLLCGFTRFWHLRGVAHGLLSSSQATTAA